MVFAEKQVEEWIPRHVDLFKREQFNPEYLKLNSKAQVPTLVHDGNIIRESSLICDYLDDLYLKPPLKPLVREQIAEMREWIKETDEGGFEAVASLSFVTVFRAKLLSMSEKDRLAYWAGQTVLERTHRQQSCVKEGYDSPYALRAIAIWERLFSKIESVLSDSRPWLLGEKFTLAEINFAPFIARLDGLQVVKPWLEDRPYTAKWWLQIKQRSSFSEARVGPSFEEAKTMEVEGEKGLSDFIKKREEYLSVYAPN